MPVETPHPQYTAMLPTWELIRDMIGGLAHVRENAAKYVPRLTGELDEQFRGRVSRGTFFGATSRTADAFLGMLLRKPPTIKATSLGEFVADTDLQAHTFPAYAANVIQQLTLVSRCGTLLDWSEDENRVYCTFYRAEEIVNWEFGRVGKQYKLKLLVLREEITEPNATDPFAPLEICQYRVLRDTDEGVLVEVHRKVNGQWQAITADYPVRKGKALDEIPFVLHNVGAEGWNCAQPLLTNVASINGQHFAQSVDLENGRHIAGIPTPYAVGFTDDPKTVLPLGASKAWVSDKEFANCGFLEFTGTGLGTLENGLKEKEGMMAALGARAMEPKGGDAEAYETVQLRASAETVSLTTMADSASASLTRVLQWASWWTGTAAKVGDGKELVAVNRDFFSAKIKADQLTALLAAFTAGAISWETYFYNLQQGELYADGTTQEEEKERREATPPPGPVPAPGDDPKTDPAKKGGGGAGE